MKTFQPIFFVTLVLFATSALAQQTATLVCDIEALQNGSNPAEVCYFAEDPDVNPEEFTIEAEVGEEIIWTGEGPLEIRKIQYYGGRNIFDADPEGERDVRARPNKKTDGEPYRYRIHFKIENTGANYKIDPIIKTK